MKYLSSFLLTIAIACANPLTPAGLHKKLFDSDLGNQGNAQIQADPSGMIRTVSLRETAVTDLSPLKGP